MDTPQDAPLRRAIASRSDFVANLHQGMTLALERRARRMLWADGDFADWPLDDPGLLQHLTDWLRLPQRQLVMLACDFGELRRRCARFVAMYRLWSHAISARTPAGDDVARLPCLLLVERVVLVQLQDKSLWRGWCSTEQASLHAWQERTDALLQRSEAAFAVTTLGL